MPSTKDKTEAKLHEVKGEIKEDGGKATNHPNLEVSGKAEKKAGKVQEWIGRGASEIDCTDYESNNVTKYIAYVRATV